MENNYLEAEEMVDSKIEAEMRRRSEQARKAVLMQKYIGLFIYTFVMALYALPWILLGWYEVTTILICGHFAQQLNAIKEKR